LCETHPFLCETLLGIAAAAGLPDCWCEKLRETKSRQDRAGRGPIGYCFA